jgi:hypothetical protein
MSKCSWRFTWTYADLAAIVGRSERSVRRAKQRGEYDPRSLGSVVTWVVRLGMAQTQSQGQR